MAFDPRNVKYTGDHLHQAQNMSPYQYPNHHTIQSNQQTDENRNENYCESKEVSQHLTISQQSSATQTIQKVDAATMTDPLRIDFRLTSEYLARYSNTLGLPYVCKSEDNNSNSSTHNCHNVQPKIEYNLEPQRINGLLDLL